MSSPQHIANSPNDSKPGEDRINRVANFHSSAADVICSDAANPSPNLHVDIASHAPFDGASSSPGTAISCLYHIH